jgi:hypothetical protein
MTASDQIQGVRVTSTSSLLLRVATIGLVGLGAASLAGCGRNGDPQVPSAAASVDRPVGIPVGATAPAKRAKKEHKSFLLDPLL